MRLLYRMNSCLDCTTSYKGSRSSNYIWINRLGAHTNTLLILYLQRYTFRVYAYSSISTVCILMLLLIGAVRSIIISSYWCIIVRSRTWLRRQAKAHCSRHSNQTLMRCFLIHGTVMSSWFVWRLLLQRWINLHLYMLLSSSKWVISSIITLARSLSTRY